MKQLAVRALMIILVSSVAAVLCNVVRPDPLAWMIDPQKSMNPSENPDLAQQIAIGLVELRDHLLNGTATLVDARKPEEFASGHLAGAINIPSTQLQESLDRVFEMVPPQGLIIIYCEGGDCASSHEVFEFLVENGFAVENLRIFLPGWEVLGREDSGLPLEVDEVD